jgi:RNA polymerase sigma-70 factor (ECF subfamily)
MLGSVHDADDAVQETLLAAWRGLGGFEGRSSLRSWLYRIATHACLRLAASRRRALQHGPPRKNTDDLGAPVTEPVWLEPYPETELADALLADHGADPEARYQEREGVELAFVAALQHLPASQRAVLILREVLHMSAAEVAELLDATVASVNSALQRARASIDDHPVVADEDRLDPDDRELLARYVDTFERYDIDSLVNLLREDAVSAMPPHDLWIQGPVEIHRWMLGPGIECKGGRLLATRANGCPAFASYRVDPEGGWDAWSLQVLELKGGRIVTIHNYLNTEILAEFGLPPRLDA